LRSVNWGCSKGKEKREDHDPRKNARNGIEEKNEPVSSTESKNALWGGGGNIKEGKMCTCREVNLTISKKGGGKVREGPTRWRVLLARKSNLGDGETQTKGEKEEDRRGVFSRHSSPGGYPTISMLERGRGHKNCGNTGKAGGRPSGLL